MPYLRSGLLFVHPASRSINFATQFTIALEACVSFLPLRFISRTAFSDRTVALVDGPGYAADLTTPLPFLPPEIDPRHQ